MQKRASGCGHEPDGRARREDDDRATDRDGTGRVTLDKVNQTKAEITLIDAIGKFEAGSMVTCPIACLTRPTE